VWGIASKGNTALSYISDTYTLLRAEGYTFPPITEKIDSNLLETAVVIVFKLEL
jgi:growth factor-regulated tyrosine kinase substrate